VQDLYILFIHPLIAEKKAAIKGGVKQKDAKAA